MAGIARYVLLAIGEGAVDCAHHGDHSASDHLRPLFVGGPVLDMAVAARSLFQEAQRLHEGLHGFRDGVGIEHLDVFEATPATSRRSSSSSVTPLAAASCTATVSGSALVASAAVSGAGSARGGGGGGISASALRLAGEQRKVHQP